MLDAATSHVFPPRNLMNAVCHWENYNFLEKLSKSLWPLYLNSSDPDHLLVVPFQFINIHKVSCSNFLIKPLASVVAP